MILLPIGRDESEIRRHAWVSYAIIAINVLVWIAVATATRPTVSSETQTAWSRAFAYYIDHPYLEPPPALRESIDPRTLPFLAQRASGMQRPDAQTERAEQATLAKLVADAVASIKHLPHFRFGYIPAEGGLFSIVSSMFIHAGFFHLFGNLLFFFLSGPFVEDVFGRPLFAALYLVGGIFAALTFGLRHPESTVPLVGASGAIAAVMGAYLFRFYRSKIEFLFVPFLLRPHAHWRFFVPAFVVLPLWFAQQFLLMTSEGQGAGVAFSAHVGGFVFGFLAAALVKVTHFEEKHVNPVVEEQTTWTMDERLVRAMSAHTPQDLEAAKPGLAAVLREQPSNIEALRAAVDVAIASDDAGMLDSCAARLLGRYAEEKDLDLANALVEEISSSPLRNLPKFLGRAAAFTERNGDRDRAVELYQRLFALDPESGAAMQSLVKIGTLLRASGETERARFAFEKARSHPACTAEWAPTIDAKIAQLNM